MENLFVISRVVIIFCASVAIAFSHQAVKIDLCSSTPVTITCSSTISKNDDIIHLVPKYTPRQDGGVFKSSNLLGSDDAKYLYCTIPACLSSPCVNGGLCIEDLNGFTCDCGQESEGQTLDICQPKRPSCQEVTCLHGSSCIDDPTIGFFCNCDPCYFGEFCEQAYNQHSEASPYYTVIVHNITVDDLYYLSPSHTVNPSDCTLRYSFRLIWWIITTPEGTIPAITIYNFDTQDLAIRWNMEFFMVATEPTYLNKDLLYLNPLQDLRRSMNLTEPHQNVGLWVPAGSADPTRQKVMLFAFGNNFRRVLPYTVKAPSNRMFCNFTSRLILSRTERYTTIQAKVLVVRPN